MDGSNESPEETRSRTEIDAHAAQNATGAAEFYRALNYDILVLSDDVSTRKLVETAFKVTEDIDHDDFDWAMGSGLQSGDAFVPAQGAKENQMDNQSVSTLGSVQTLEDRMHRLERVAFELEQKVFMK